MNDSEYFNSKRIQYKLGDERRQNEHWSFSEGDEKMIFGQVRRRTQNEEVSTAEMRREHIRRQGREADPGHLWQEDEKGGAGGYTPGYRDVEYELVNGTITPIIPRDEGGFVPPPPPNGKTDYTTYLLYGGIALVGFLLLRQFM